MSAPIISVRNLGKKYQLGDAKQDTLRDQIVHNIGRFFSKSETRPAGEFWALRNASFDLQQGEVLGIIGRNGAGKSTLLKLLSQITEPTEGEVRIRGRIASLLEVGTGFHPELSGRENIYLNGAILGMAKAEIRSKFEEIVSFAGVGKFLDTPVKKYSSGMYVRLAFSVAAHLEPEILIVDEVLAVGDSAFQKKCMGKMREIGRSGRTILFISHSMGAIESLCSRCLLIDGGRLIADDQPEVIVRQYIENTFRVIDGIALADRTDRSGSGIARVVGFRIVDEAGATVSAVRSGELARFEITYHNNQAAEIPGVAVALSAYDEKNTRLIHLNSGFSNQNMTLAPGRGAMAVTVEDWPLAVGIYRIDLSLTIRAELLDWIEDAGSVSVEGGDFFGTGNPGWPAVCKVLTRSNWEMVRKPIG